MMDKTTIFSSRLRAFMDHLRSQGKIYNDADFCTKIGKNRPMVSEMLHSKRPITKGFATNLASVFPEFNPDWLTDESCTRMLCEAVDSPFPPTPMPVVMDTSGELERLHRIIDQQQTTIDRLLRIIERMQDGKDQD